MGGLFRMVVCVPFAGVVVVGLFLFMWTQIRPADVVELEEAEPVQISVTRQIEDSEVRNARRFERPKLDAPPPPPPAIERQNF